MAQGFSFKGSAAKGGKQQKGPKPGARVIKPKKQHAIQAAKIQKKITSKHVKMTESMLMQKTRGMGEGQFRLITPDKEVMAQVQAAKAKKEQKRENEKSRPVKMAPKRADEHQ